MIKLKSTINKKIEKRTHEGTLESKLAITYISELSFVEVGSDLLLVVVIFSSA